jgi:hypothetical protein
MNMNVRKRWKDHILLYMYDVKLVPCQHGLVGPQVVDRGDGLWIWRVAANILNKQSQTALQCGGWAWG